MDLEDANFGARSEQTMLWFQFPTGFGASKRSRKGRLGSVSDYCLHHCDCPVVVVRFPEDKDGETVMHRSHSRPRTPSPHAPLSPPPKIQVQMDQKIGGVDKNSFWGEVVTLETRGMRVNVLRSSGVDGMVYIAFAYEWSEIAGHYQVMTEHVVGGLYSRGIMPSLLKLRTTWWIQNAHVGI